MDFFTHAALLAAGAVTLATQVLKLKIIPIQFANKYPVPTNIILSVVASIFILPLHWSMANLGADLVQVATIAVIAALTYNQLLARWSELKALEG